MNPARPRPVTSAAHLLVVAILLAAATAAGILAPAPAFARQPPSYIPATFNAQSDSLGFPWNMNQQGHMDQGQNSCFTVAMSLQVNSANFTPSPNTPGIMSPDGLEYIITGNAGGQVEVTRRIRFDLKASCVRYIDTISNPTSTAVPATITLMNQFGNRFDMLYTDRGTSGSSLTGRESGVVAVHKANSGKPSVLFVVSSPNARLRPTIVSHQNYQLRMDYNVTIEPGKRVSIASIIAQRNLSSTNITPQLLAPLFKPLTLARANRDLPIDLRGTLQNAGPGPGEGRSVNQLEALNIAPANTDTLALGEDTRLTGSLTWGSLAITTAYGKRNLNADEVAAITGPQSTGHTTQVFLRDGQVLTGSLEATDMRFTLSSGSVVELAVGSLDRIMMRQRKGSDAASTATQLETTSGDRLSIAAGPAASGLRLLLRSPWGERTATLDEIISLRPMDDGNVGYRVALSDGSVFTAFLDGTSLELQTALFGPRKIPIVHVRGIYNPSARQPLQDADKDDLAAPHTVLAGGQVLAGRVELPELHMTSNGQTIPVAPGQIRELHNTSDGADLPIDRPIVFKADLWGGGSISGEIRQSLLPFRVGDKIWQIPTRDIVDVVVPVPIISEGMRDNIARLIRDLGVDEWEKRETATQELTNLGYLAKAQLAEAAQQAQDAEVRTRAQKILDALNNANP
ncbi:hypothetical protein DB346_16710 [Verrucomicrobia bacterium LW23]|nr:hypothetical protein DB346_16710 [Verrucomicrobia bacterium LW23]